MVVNCEQVWQEISNYLENDLDPSLRASLEEHLRGCKRCTAVLDGTRNIVHLYGDGRLFQVPMGYSARLHRKIADNMPGRRGTAFGWLVALAALALFTGTLGLANSVALGRPVERSEHAQPGRGIPPDLTVLVAEHGKLFHIAGCTFIHNKDGKVRSLSSREAMREGYTPCARCLGEYLSRLAANLVRKQTWAMLLR
jgi:hypothetical protein